MSENKKVYVITSGNYSDYGINCVFDNLEDAKKYIDIHSEEAYPPEIEEYILNEDRITKSHRKIYRIGMDYNGLVLVSYVDVIEERDLMNPEISEYWTGNLCLRMGCFADDKKHAIKIVNEKRSQIIAMGLWREGEINI